MEKTVTLRFYNVRRTVEHKPALTDLLNRITAVPIADRGHRFGQEEIFVRLENAADGDTHVAGQFIRGQSGNRPGRMLDEGTDSLPFPEPLGHGMAFCYRKADGLLAVEYNPLILSPNRTLDYIYQFDATAEYQLEPRMREDAWRVFDQLPTRKLIVGIAGQPTVGGDDDPDAAVWANVADMKERFGAHVLRFEISRGHKGGTLKDDAKRFAHNLWRRHEDHGEDVRTLRAVVETDDNIPNEEIDLMGEFFNVKADLAFDQDDWPRFYALRRDLLRSRIDLL